MTYNVTQMQRTIEDQKRIINALQNENHWYHDLIMNADLTETDMRLAVVTIPREVRCGIISIEEAPERKIFYPAIAEDAHCSEKVASQRIRKLAKKGVFSYRRACDVDEQGNRTDNTRVFLQPKAMAETPAQITTERVKPGGSTWKDGKRVKRCKDCGSANLLKVSQLICGDCGSPQDDKIYRPINNTDDILAEEQEKANCHNDGLVDEEDSPDDEQAKYHYDSLVDEEDEESDPSTTEDVYTRIDGRYGQFGLVEPPAFLREKRIWCVGRIEDDEEHPGEKKKVPYIVNPPNGDYRRRYNMAKSNDPGTWVSYDEAKGLLQRSQSWKVPFHGLMYACDGSFCFAELDDCRDPETGQWTEEAITTIERIHSASYESWSGDGVHILSIATVPHGRHPKGRGIFSERRFAWWTGKHLDGTPVELQERQEVIDAYYQEYFPEPEPTQFVKGACTIEEHEVLLLAETGRDAEKFKMLWNADAFYLASHYPRKERKDGTVDHSRADAALCAILAFWSSYDADMVDRLFRKSKLCREKWERRADYRRSTLRYVGCAVEEAA